ncbi:MAG: hypothetical protein BYD32DRAFT_402860 [Podila humilis]|nr:MAG: hypothetical protein BYD32DRAFT_402860 [Podila humilis]
MLSHQHSLVAASTSKSGAPTVDCDLAIKSIPFQQLRDPYASGEVLEGSDTDSDDELTTIHRRPTMASSSPRPALDIVHTSIGDRDADHEAGGSFTLKRPAIVDRTTTRGIDTDMDSSDSELDDSDFEDGPQATRSILLNRPTEPQANIGHLHVCLYHWRVFCKGNLPLMLMPLSRLNNRCLIAISPLPKPLKPYRNCLFSLQTALPSLRPQPSLASFLHLQRLLGLRSKL